MGKCGSAGKFRISILTAHMRSLLLSILFQGLRLNTL